MGILAMSSTSVVDVLDGVGISSSIIEYAVSSSGTQPPGNPITDGEGNPILDNDGKALTDGEWSTTLPSVPEGQFLWTRTRLIRSDGSFDMIYTVSQNGSTGATGATITNQKEQYYLSSSPTQLTGGTWGYEEPNPIPTGKYLWGRFENIMSDGTVTYSTAVYRSTISGVINLTNEIDGKITQKIWQSDIDSTIEDYDNPTGTSSLRDRVTQTESDISGITQTVGQVQSTLATKADGSTVTTLQNDYSQFKQTMGGFKTTVESSYAQLTDVDNKIANIKVGGNNLYVIADEIPGYVAANGTISGQNSTYKEFTSAYIPVQEDEDYIIQSWATPTNETGESWLAYQFYANTTGTTVGARQAKYGKDSNSGVTITAEGQEHLSYSVKVPQNANYLRVSYRKFNDGYAMVEKATVPSEYSINTRDVEEMVNSIDIGVRNLLKEADIGTTPKTSKGITVDYEGNGWFHIYGTVTGTSNGLVCLYGSTSRTSNLISEPGEYTFSVYGDMNTNTDVKYQIATHSNTATNDTIASSMTLGANQQEMTFTLANGYHVSRVAFYINDVATGDEVDLHVRMKLEKGNKSTDWTPAPEDTIAQISNTRTIAEQTADRFGWIVQDGSTQSSVQYTANALTAMANQIDLTGNVTFNSMSSIANNAINGLKAYVGTSSTAAGTATKVVDCTDTDFQLINGVTITITFSTANTADALKLNVKSTGEKVVYYDTAVTSQNNRFRWQANSVITFQYDGTNWVVLRYETREYFACSTAESTAAKITNSATGSFILCKGTTVNVYFSKANTANATTLNVGATGAFSICYKNAVTSASNQYFWDAGATITFTYNGSYWYVSDNGTQLVKNYAKIAVDWVGTNESIIDAWKGVAENNVTTINGGLVQTHTILAKNLATNAIMSENYSSGTQNQDTPSSTDNPAFFSQYGTFMDLTNGNIYSPNFTVINSDPFPDDSNVVTPGTFMNGTVHANAGYFGSSTQHWNIEKVYDYNNVAHAALVGVGSPYIQTGNWQISDNQISTKKYTSTAEATGRTTYYKDASSNTFYDVGVKIPTNFTAPSDQDGKDVTFAKSFFYGRKYTGDNIPAFDDDWSYLFMVDNAGNLYEKGQLLSERYAAIGDVEGAYVSTTGGTVNGNLTVTGTLTATASAAATLSTARNLNVNLATTSNDGKVAFDGSANVTLGITGTLGVDHGGTGGTLDVAHGGTGKQSWSTSNAIIYASGSTTLSQLSTGNSGDILQSKGSNAAPDWVAPNTLSVGYASSADTANTSTTATTATKVSKNLSITLNGTTTTYNGSTARSFTFGAAATKNVDDSSISSSSTNLPTSSAVVSFVEGKGYINSTGTIIAGHITSWNDTGTVVTDSGVSTSDLIKNVQINGSNLILTKADGTQAAPVPITITAQAVSGSIILTDSNGDGLNVGDANTPVYFSNGLPSTISYTINSNVPSNAVFTDTTDLTQMTGVLEATHGGTGQDTLQKSMNALINSLSTGNTSNIPLDEDYFISQYIGGNTSGNSNYGNTNYYRRPMSALWNYVNGKASSAYAALSGATFTGAVTGTSFAADIIQTKTNTSTTTGGLALYSNGNPMIYGIAMRGTGTTSGEGGTHGYVTGNWAIYHSIAGGGSDRGWILRNSTTSANVASVSNAGHAVFNGSVTVGGNATNTSGCELIVDNDLGCLNFVWK